MLNLLPWGPGSVCFLPVAFHPLWLDSDGKPRALCALSARRTWWCSRRKLDMHLLISIQCERQCRSHEATEKLLLNDKTPGFLASRGDDFNPGLETRLDCSELLCNKVLLKYKGDRGSF